MVLAGSKVPREQVDPVPVAAIINAAASEVEDYARIVTASVPDSEVLGTVAGDLVHLLAEILDNALRYSPPISQVRVSAVHTGNGGLVFEVSDIGLGMAESDLRVANVRLQSGGEVNPYTARHMGLFVVGRLAAQHGLIVRLRSTVAGEPNSGTTAGIFLPAALLLEQPGGYHDDVAEYAAPVDAHAGITTALALDEDHSNNGAYPISDEYAEHDDGYGAGYGTDYGVEPEYRNGHVDIPVSLLPQRNPGASGISGIPSLPPAPVVEPESDWADDDEWPEDSMPAQTPPDASGPTPQPARSGPAPSDTSAFFASRQQVPNQYAPPSNGVPSVAAPPPPPPATPKEPAAASSDAPVGERSSSTDPNSIFNKMLSEWLIDDPIELANSTDLDWQTVWDHGWSAAAAAEDVPVEQHTEHGLPMREPGARLVPGAAEVPSKDGNGNGRHRNGDAERVDTDPAAQPSRDPEAVRSSISEHFGGVHAGRTRAKESRETDQQ
jgi:hypothetical protein